MGQPQTYRRNPVASARDEFLEEPQPDRFFPRSGSSGSFGPYYSGEQIANASLDSDKYLGAKDDLLTRRYQNEFQRRDYMSRSRVMPYSEAADIASQKSRAVRSASEERLNPFMEEADKEQAMTSAETSRAIRGGIGERAELEKVERAKRMEALMSDDPEEQKLSKWTNDPQDLLTYRALYNRVDPKLPKQERQAAAFRKTVRLAQDREVIGALHEAAASGIVKAEAIDALLEPEMDDKGNYYGDYIKQDPAARRAVQRILANNATQKMKMAQEKEERIASQSDRAAMLRVLSDRESEYRKIVADEPKNEEARATLNAIKARVDAILFDGKSKPGQSQPAPTAPQAGQPAVKAGKVDLEAIFRR
jgi:hypothetical protein